MENPGLVTFRDEFVFRSAVTDTQRQTRAMVIAHEMAHMWFGDLVTLKWWDDIWLNESFAEYMGYQTTAEATRFTDTWTDFGVTRKPWGYDADQRPSTHPVAPENVEDTASALLNFDGISYAKGASALRQLVTWLGEKDFLAGINIHFERHRFANATLGDFIDSLAAATDRDVHAWADAWLRTTGVDTLTPRITGDNGDRALTVDHTGSRPHRIAVGLYDRDLTDEGRLTLRSRLDVDVPQSEPRPIGKRPALAVLNDGDLTYAKIRFDTESFQALRTGLAGLPDPLTRAVVWNALRDAVRDGDLAPTDFLDIARTHLPHERDLALVDGVLTFAGTQVADRYVTPEQRPAALATLTDLCRDLIRRTEDGDHPGLRLIAVRHRIATAAPPTPSPPGSPTAPSPAAPNSTPNCAGASSPASPSSAPPTKPPSPPNSPPTPAPPARKAPPAAAPPCPTPRPRPAPGRPCSPPTTSPTTSSPPPPKASGSPNRPTSYATTSPATTPKPSPSPPAAAPPSPTPPAAGPSPPTPSTPTPCAWAGSASTTPNRSPPCDASSPTSSTTSPAPCGYGRRPHTDDAHGRFPSPRPGNRPRGYPFRVVIVGLSGRTGAGASKL